MMQPRADIVTLAASVQTVPTVEEMDAILDGLRRLPRDAAMTSLIDDLLEFRSVLGATSLSPRAEQPG